MERYRDVERDIEMWKDMDMWRKKRNRKDQINC